MSSKSTSSITKLAQTSAPPIPEPDYSCTDSEGESEDEQKDVTTLASKLMSVQLQPVENSGNSNTRLVKLHFFCFKKKKTNNFVF